MQVAKKLRCAIWTEEFGRLDLDHELLVDDHVECLTSERFAAEKDHHRYLSLDTMALRHEISFECQIVDVFPEAKPELP
jgi:hypothetical protein